MTASPELDAVDLAEATRIGKASVIETIEHVLHEISTRDRELNSVVVVLAEEARAAAIEAQKQIDTGEVLGPLHGVPVTIKEPIWVKDAPATNGSRALADRRADDDATAVRRLRDAGAIVVGKTNIPEFQFRGICDNPIYGLTVNPWDPRRTCGGSSGGAAASLATGITPLALGSDGGGSIRIPASWCGIVGMKPSRDLVPTGPARAGSPSVSVLGPMARSVRDIDLMLGVLAGRGGALLTEPGDNIRGLRLAYSADLGFAPCDDDVRVQFEVQIELLRQAGWDLHPAHPHAGDPTATWYRLFETELYAANRELVKSSPELIDEMVLGALRSAAEVSASEYLDAKFEASLYTDVWRGFFEDYDVLITPSSAIPAFAAGQAEPNSVSGRQPDKVAFAAALLPANVTGFPALTVPAFFSDSMPVGLQFVAPHGRDSVLLQAGSAYEGVRGTLPVAPLPSGETKPSSGIHSDLTKEYQ